MSAVVKVLKREPFLAILGGMVTFASGGALFMIGRSLSTDPTICLSNRKNNPMPWLDLPQNKNIKIYSPKRHFDDPEVKETYLH